MSNQTSKLRVNLSRPLTYSEREALRIYFLGEELTHEWVDASEFFLIFAYDEAFFIADEVTRDVAWNLHEKLGKDFFNVHLTGVRTLTPSVYV